MRQLVQFKFHFIFSIITVLFLLGSSTQAQEFSGTITDGESGEPLFGASIVLTGTAVGATTDFDGKFKFSPGKQPPFQVTVSYIGYLKQEIEAYKKRQLHISKFWLQFYNFLHKNIK